jgi:hypothetical protein
MLFFRQTTYISLIQNPVTISEYAFRINVIDELLRESDSKLVNINREADLASHEIERQT